MGGWGWLASEKCFTVWYCRYTNIMKYTYLSGGGGPACSKARVQGSAFCSWVQTRMRITVLKTVSSCNISRVCVHASKHGENNKIPRIFALMVHLCRALNREWRFQDWRLPAWLSGWLSGEGLWGPGAFMDSPIDAIFRDRTLGHH